jgi:hypothetical protein
VCFPLLQKGWQTSWAAAGTAQALTEPSQGKTTNGGVTADRRGTSAATQ